MNLYISKKNLSSFIDAVKPIKNNAKDEINIEKYKYVNCLLKFNIYFDFEKQKSDGGYGPDDDKDDEDEDKNSKIRSWVKRCMSQSSDSNSDNKHKYYRNDCTQYPNEYSIEAIKDNKEYLSSVYLVEDYEEGLENIVLCGKPGEETKVLDRLFCGDSKDFYQFHFLPNFSWNDLGNVPPCTDIIISDRYLFSTTKVQRDFVEDYNIKPMLKALTKNTKGKINIVVFTSDFASDPKCIGEKDAKDIITTAVIENTGEEPNVFFVVPSPTNAEQPHDRIIITNYRLLVSGDSFIYFKSNGLETKGFYLISGSLAENNINNFKEEALIQLDNWYTINKGRGCHIKGDKHGDKISNFLSSTMNVIPEDVDVSNYNNQPKLKPKEGEDYDGKIISEKGHKIIKSDKFPKYTFRFKDDSGNKFGEGDEVTFTTIYDNNHQFLQATNVRKKQN